MGRVSSGHENPRIGSAIAIALIVEGASFVFHGALKTYFAQYDFADLARATGILPRHASAWRYLTLQTFMDVWFPVIRTHAVGYHLVCLALHVLNASVLFLMLRRRFSTFAAFMGSSFFAFHPALFTALYWISARGDILATSFALATIALALRQDRWRWLSAPVFLMALLSKESVIGLPAVIGGALVWGHDRQDGSSPARRIRARLADPLLGVLCAESLVGIVYLLRSPTVGIGIAAGTGSAYALAFGPSIPANLITYIAWATGLSLLRPGLRFVDQQDPGSAPLVLLTLAIAVVLAFWPAVRRRGWLAWIVMFLLLLSPVLPLRNHVYRYYLYLPLIGIAFSLAALLDAVTERLTGRVATEKPGARTDALSHSVHAFRAGTAGWVAGLALWLAAVVGSERIVHYMEVRPSRVYPGLRGDPIIDRARIAERVIAGLQSAAEPPGTRMVFIMRERIALIARVVRGSGEARPPNREAYPETNVRASVFDGIGVRAMVPAIDSVEFALALGNPDERTRYAIYAPTGDLEVFDTAGVDSLLRSSWVTRW